MNKAATKASLSPARKRLLRQMQKIDFGRIENLVIRRGEPVFKPDPKSFFEIRFGSENSPRRELGIKDFVLKAQVVELFDYLTCLGNGTVERLEIRHGVPFRLVTQGIRI